MKFLPRNQVFARAVALTVGLLMGAQPISHAAGTFTANPDPADARALSDGTVDNVGNFAIRIGEQNAPRVGVAVLPFLLQNVIAGEQVTDASFRLQLFNVINANNGGLANIDFYGILAPRATATVLASDFFAGPGPNPAGTLIQDNIITPASPVRIDPNNGFITTSASGNTALASYLNTINPNGANNGMFGFLLLSYDQNPAVSGNNGYEVLTQDAGGLNEKPLLTFTTAAVPEPSTMALAIAFGGAAILWRRRRA